MSLDERDYMRRPQSRSDSGKVFSLGQASTARRSPTTRTNDVGAWLNAITPWLAGILVVLLIAVGIKFLMEQRRALPFPESGEALWFTDPKEPKVAMLRLAAPSASGKDFAVRLDDWVSGAPVVLIHVRRGESSATLVPLGRYRMTIAKGKQWLGSDKLFGVSGEIQESLHPMDFVRRGNEISGNRIELEVPFQGNMEVKRVWGQ